MGVHAPRFLVWYYVWGVFHEVSHVVAALALVPFRPPYPLVGRLLGQCLLPSRFVNLAPLLSVLEEDKHQKTVAMDTIRHAGWMTNLVLALVATLVWWLVWKKNSLSSSSSASSSTSSSSRSGGDMLVMAAWITALEALSTDLFLLGSSASANSIFWCGNFGIILVHANDWVGKDGGRKALDLLERMIYITMMRGAQSGGVVAWSAPRRKQDEHQLVGIRSRVVNAKRTDLSKKLRAKIQRDVGGAGRAVRPGIRGFFGHTRFATTSKATFDGTHPHQWTPPQMRRIYPLDEWNSDTAAPTPIQARVENFITHNGDLDFFAINEVYFDLETIQKWLVKATGAPMPAAVDSAAIAGLVDVLRTAGCFGLSLRFALLMQMPESKMDPDRTLPNYQAYEQLGTVLEQVLASFCRGGDGDGSYTLAQISASPLLRQQLVSQILQELTSTGQHEQVKKPFSSFSPSSSSLGKDENDNDRGDVESQMLLGGSTTRSRQEEEWWSHWMSATVQAFFDNTLMRTTILLLQRARGSFGLMVTSSMDAHRQVCLAARGQTMSIAFYPERGVICYGSEQAAVKAGLSFDRPGGNVNEFTKQEGVPDLAYESVRIDLDDLGGEVCLLDWGPPPPTPKEEVAVSVDTPPPSKDTSTMTYPVMGGNVRITLFHTSKATDAHLSKRMTPLKGNDFVGPVPHEEGDLVLKDIQDIPQVCQAIQSNWKTPSLNRLTAWSLVRSVKKRLQARVDGKIGATSNTVDILLTGCEVSLWLAEQLAADWQKAFPKLFIKAWSSNKLLGVFGQDLTVPTIGHPMANVTPDLHDTVVIIVSHSGGTFAPLACSNLLQSFTESIFVVASEWDTQIGKQLRSMYQEKGNQDLLTSRIFSTNVGVRPAEPCSVSVAATHQLLTYIFQHVSTAILTNHDFRHLSGAVITEDDLQILERCNQDNIAALEYTVGVDCDGRRLDPQDRETEHELREIGNLWSQHILENVRAYIMSFIYIVVTVTTGYPLVTGIATACGLSTDWALYVTRFLDSLVYFFLPQINVFIVRIVQGRNLRHRMVGRTVVVADVPWVAQAADAFLSKLFACSYSIAGLNVIHGNPADHLVHRHTHRVVRGTLLVCGRPDGRLAALTSADATACLSVNQASSIQSLGGTCESVTIGHNPTELSLTLKDVFLRDDRPNFLCEQLLRDQDIQESPEQSASPAPTNSRGASSRRFSLRGSYGSFAVRRSTQLAARQQGVSRSVHGLMGSYMSMKSDRSSLTQGEDAKQQPMTKADQVMADMMKEKHRLSSIRSIFNRVDKNRSGDIDEEEFLEAYKELAGDSTPRDTLLELFREADADNSGLIDFDEFAKLARMGSVERLRQLQVVNRNDQGLSIVEPSRTAYFGAEVRDSATASEAASSSQRLAMELYESRVASLQRFVAMTVLFHEMGHTVQSFFASLGWGYRMDRTHSIMRIATTASPVSGADVRERMEELQLRKKIMYSVDLVSRAWRVRKDIYLQEKIKMLEES